MDQTVPQAAPQPEPRPRAGWRAKLLLLAITLLVLLVLDFVAARVYRVVTGHPWPARNPARVYRIPVDPYHHGLRANFSTDSANWGGNYPFRTNSLGFKDASVREVPLVPKGKRIIVIGDSFTEGVGVPFADTYAGRLAAAFAPSGVEVLNAGTQSYTPIIYYRKIKYFVETVGVKCDEVIVGVDESDASNELEYELVDDVVRPIHLRDRLAEALRTNSIVLWTIADYMNEQSFIELNQHGVAGAPSPRDALRLGSDAEIEAELARISTVSQMTWPNAKTLDPAVEAGIRCMTQNMDRLLAFLKTRSIGLTVVVYPWPHQILVGDPECRQVTLWRDWCEKNGVRFVDAFKKFEMGCPMRRRAEILDTCFVPGDTHFNAEGHRRVAEAILEAMPPPTTK